MTTTPAALAAAFIMLNFFLSFFCLTPRLYRMFLGISTNSNPRQDMANFGAKSLAEGKTTKNQIERLSRWESAQQNAVENFPLFIAAIIFALLGRMSTSEFIGLGVGYSACRVAFAIAYILTENELLSYARSIFWWLGNGVCFWGIIMGARGIEQLTV